MQMHHSLCDRLAYEATNKIRYSELCTLMRLLGPRLQCDEKMASVRLRNKVRPITLEEKIQMTLRYLAGDRVLAIMDTYGASKSFVYSTIDTVMEAIINHPDLKIRFPHTEEERRIVKEDFQYKSYCGIIRGCLGAIDGWLCLINTPRTDEVLGGNVESYFSGHYQTYGINVQAAVDAHCRFIAVSIRCPGSTSDSQAWMDWGLRREIDSFKVGEYLVGDNAYPCSDQLLTPFNKVEKGTDESRDAFNFYLSQTRIRVEMAFGYLTNKFQIFKRPLTCPLKKTTVIVLAAMTIHNFYITERLKNTAGYQIPFSYPDVVHARKVPYTVNGKRKHKIVTSTEITCDTRVSANKTPFVMSLLEVEHFTP